MDKTTNIRMERIEKLLNELRYEIERGMIEREISEEITYKFIVPFSRAIPDGIVHCEFRTKPIARYRLFGEDFEPQLKIVK